MNDSSHKQLRVERSGCLERGSIAIHKEQRAWQSCVSVVLKSAGRPLRLRRTSFTAQSPFWRILLTWSLTSLTRWKICWSSPVETPLTRWTTGCYTLQLLALFLRNRCILYLMRLSGLALNLLTPDANGNLADRTRCMVHESSSASAPSLENFYAWFNPQYLSNIVLDDKLDSTEPTHCHGRCSTPRLHPEIASDSKSAAGKGVDTLTTEDASLGCS